MCVGISAGGSNDRMAKWIVICNDFICNRFDMRLFVWWILSYYYNMILNSHEILIISSLSHTHKVPHRG